MDNTIVKSITSQGIDKTAIKNFAVYARNKLIKDIKNKAAMIGVTESGLQKPLSISTGNIQLFDIGMQEPYRIEGKVIAQRNGLIRELKKRAQGSTYLTAYQTLIEEVAYTWFNRIIAIRFMEVNNYMPDRMRILSSGVEGINEPEFITHVFETNFEFSEEEKKHIIELKMDGSNLATDELFQHLFIKQCNALNANLPELFEKTNDYTELLLTVSYNDVEGIIFKLVHDVPEMNFDMNSENGNGQVEIIGWLYQFYNTEPKATVFSRPKSKKIEKQDIPAATQLFTPEWIVKYMVENSLGRLWIEKLLANNDLRMEKQIANDFGWKYYLPEAEQDERVRKQLENLQNERKDLSVEDITFLDPAMGSFHIGIYAFDVYMQLYESEGYTTREAARLIVEKNLRGLDIDKRASQLSYFACMMQARKYNRRILEGNLQPNIYEITESNHINREHLNYLGNNIEDTEEWDRLKLQLVSVLNTFIDAKEYGSLMNISDKYDFSQLRKFVMSHSVDSQISLLETVGLEETQKELVDIINVADIISKKYDVVITNPPYMSGSAMDKKLSDFAKKYYPDSKSDMFAMFIEKCENYTTENGYFSLITQHAWMFLSSYEKLRNSLLTHTLVNMAHLGTRAFEEIGGEVVQTTSFVYLNNNVSNYTGNYVKLTNFNNQSKKETAYLELFNGYKKKYLYETNQVNFNKIPGSPIAYWVSKKVMKTFNNPLLHELADARLGMATASNDRFIKLWYEVPFEKIGIGINSREEAVNSCKKWFPYDKGGSYRRWYGNNEYVVNWENDGFEIRNFKDSNGKVRSHNYNLDYIFKPGLTWSALTSGKFSSRITQPGYLFDNAGSKLFSNTVELEYLQGILNSKISDIIFDIINPTINYQPGTISSLPIVIDKKDEVIKIVKKLNELAKEDWDLFETSWDFNNHPLLVKDSSSIEENYKKFMDDINNRFYKVLGLEETLNETILQIYNLQEEVSSAVLEGSTSITKIVERKKGEDNNNIYTLEKKDVINTLISYAVGCIFGRYGIYKEETTKEGEKLSSKKESYLKRNAETIISFTDENFFFNNVTNQFIEFIRASFGVDNLEANLSFIGDGLVHIKGESSREVIKNYFINNFFKDHIKMYQNRPIYWLYDSGKENGFKALVYMHRYDEDTTGKVRVDYLHQVQRAYERTLANLQEEITNSKDVKEITHLQKQLEKITKQLKECRDYDEHLGHMALERIAIDLDDGVKVNYEKVQTDNKGKFHQILAKIK